MDNTTYHIRIAAFNISKSYSPTNINTILTNGAIDLLVISKPPTSPTNQRRNDLHNSLILRSYETRDTPTPK